MFYIRTVISSGKLDTHLVGDHNTDDTGHTDIIRAMTDRKYEMIVNLSDIALKSKEADTKHFIGA